jgi:hypothetical protein
MEYTRPATWDDLRCVAQYLAHEGVSYALIGGYALALHGFHRFSEDIDILVDPSPSNTERWIRALSRLPDAACAELSGTSDLFAGDGPPAIRVNDEFTVDVMASACGHAWAELAPHIDSRDLDGVYVKVLSLRGLLLTKEGMRPKDRMDAAVLREAIAALDVARDEP